MAAASRSPISADLSTSTGFAREAHAHATGVNNESLLPDSLR